MTKKKLIRFIRFQTTTQESETVLEWIEKDIANKQYYISLKNLIVSESLSQEKASLDELREIQSLTTEKTANSNNRKRARTLLFYKITSIAAILLLAASVFYNLYDNNARTIENDIAYLSALPSDQKYELYVVKGAKAKIILPDSSVVWMNSDSRIVYPSQFQGTSRQVLLSGEAYFDVTPNKDMPMVVTTTKGFQVEVLGTEFNLRAYENENKAYAALYSGKINLITHDLKSGKERITDVMPDQIFEIENNILPKLLVKKEVKDEKLWVDGKLKFQSTPMDEVIKKLERWHGTEFKILDKSIYHYDLTASFGSESIIQIMEILQYCIPITYKIENNKVSISMSSI